MVIVPDSSGSLGGEIGRAIWADSGNEAQLLFVDYAPHVACQDTHRAPFIAVGCCRAEVQNGLCASFDVRPPNQDPCWSADPGAKPQTNNRPPPAAPREPTQFGAGARSSEVLSDWERASIVTRFCMERNPRDGVAILGT